MKKKTVKADTKKVKKVVSQRRSKSAPVVPQPTAVVPVKETKKLAAEKRASKKNEALADKIAAAPDAPHIECRLIVGELSVPVDASDLCHTLGAGTWGHGDGLVDAYPDTVWSGLLAHLGLPAFPLDRTVAERPVKRLVQRLWYEAIQGRVPEERATVFATRDAESVECYKKDFPNVAVEAQAKSERAKTSFGRKPGDETRYTPTDKLKDKKLILSGQQAPLLAFFRAAKFAPATAQAAGAGMVEHGLKTTQPPERVAAYYLAMWSKKEWVTR